MNVRFFIRIICLLAVSHLLLTPHNHIQAADKNQRISIPSNLGKVSLQKKNNTVPGVILIRDLHCIPDAQENIAKIIMHLKTTYGVSLFCLEGAEGPLDTSFLSKLPNRDIVSSVCSDFISRGVLSGAEKAAILLSESDSYFTGIEQSNLYCKDLKQFRSVYSNNDTVSDIFTSLKRIIQRLQNEYYNSDMLLCESAYEAFKTNSISLSQCIDIFKRKSNKSRNDFLAAFSEIRTALSVLEEQNTLEMTALQHELGLLITQLQKTLSKNKLEIFIATILKYQMKQINEVEFFSKLELLSPEVFNSLKYSQVRKYKDFLSKRESIDAEVLEKEINSLKSSLLRTFATEVKQHALMSISDRINLLEELLLLESSSENYNHIQNNKSSFSFNTILQSILEIIPETMPDTKTALSNLPSDILEDVIGEADIFYSIAQERDRHFVNKALSIQEELSVPFLVIVAGGFHTDGIAAELKNQQIPYAVITPRIQQIYETPYLSLLLDNNIQLTTSFIAPTTLAIKLATGDISGIGDSRNIRKQMAEAGLEVFAEKFIETLEDTTTLETFTAEVLAEWDPSDVISEKAIADIITDVFARRESLQESDAAVLRQFLTRSDVKNSPLLTKIFSTLILQITRSTLPDDARGGAIYKSPNGGPYSLTAFLNSISDGNPNLTGRLRQLYSKKQFSKDMKHFLKDLPETIRSKTPLHQILSLYGFEPSSYKGYHIPDALDENLDILKKMTGADGVSLFEYYSTVSIENLLSQLMDTIPNITFIGFEDGVRTFTTYTLGAAREDTIYIDVNFLSFLKQRDIENARKGIKANLVLEYFLHELLETTHLQHDGIRQLQQVLFPDNYRIPGASLTVAINDYLTGILTAKNETALIDKMVKQLAAKLTKRNTSPKDLEEQILTKKASVTVDEFNTVIKLLNKLASMDDKKYRAGLLTKAIYFDFDRIFNFVFENRDNFDDVVVPFFTMLSDISETDQPKKQHHLADYRDPLDEPLTKSGNIDDDSWPYFIMMSWSRFHQIGDEGDSGIYAVLNRVLREPDTALRNRFAEFFSMTDEPFSFNEVEAMLYRIAWNPVDSTELIPLLTAALQSTSFTASETNFISIQLSRILNNPAIASNFYLVRKLLESVPYPRATGRGVSLYEAAKKLDGDRTSSKGRRSRSNALFRMFRVDVHKHPSVKNRDFAKDIFYGIFKNDISIIDKHISEKYRDELNNPKYFPIPLQQVYDEKLPVWVTIIRKAIAEYFDITVDELERQMIESPSKTLEYFEDLMRLTPEQFTELLEVSDDDITSEEAYLRDLFICWEGARTRYGDRLVATKGAVTDFATELQELERQREELFSSILKMQDSIGIDADYSDTYHAGEKMLGLFGYMGTVASYREGKLNKYDNLRTETMRAATYISSWMRSIFETYEESHNSGTALSESLQALQFALTELKYDGITPHTVVLGDIVGIYPSILIYVDRILSDGDTIDDILHESLDSMTNDELYEFVATYFDSTDLSKLLSSVSIDMIREALKKNIQYGTIPHDSFRKKLGQMRYNEDIEYSVEKLFSHYATIKEGTNQFIFAVRDLKSPLLAQTISRIRGPLNADEKAALIEELKKTEVIVPGLSSMRLPNLIETLQDPLTLDQLHDVLTEITNELQNLYDDFNEIFRPAIESIANHTNPSALRPEFRDLMQSDLDPEMKRAILTEQVLGNIVGDVESLKNVSSILQFILFLLDIDPPAETKTVSSDNVESEFIDGEQPLNRSKYGSKAANLNWLAHYEYPVPDAFVLSASGAPKSMFEPLPEPTRELVLRDLKKLSDQTGKVLALNPADLLKERDKEPLLLSLRSGSRFSMPGVLHTISNAPMNDAIVTALIDRGEDPAFVLDTYRRFLTSYGVSVLNIHEDYFANLIDRFKEAYLGNTKTPLAEFSLLNRRALIQYFKQTFYNLSKTVQKLISESQKENPNVKESLSQLLKELSDVVSIREYFGIGLDALLTLPDEEILQRILDASPLLQHRFLNGFIEYKNKQYVLEKSGTEILFTCIEAIYNSWDSLRSREYRQNHSTRGNWGTAVILQEMIFGNSNPDSGTAVIFSHDPQTGSRIPTGEYKIMAQGEDLVSGVTMHAVPFSAEQANDGEPSLENTNPLLYSLIASKVDSIVDIYGAPQDTEWTVQDNEPNILQTRSLKLSKPQNRIAFPGRDPITGTGLSGGAIWARIMKGAADIEATLKAVRLLREQMDSSGEQDVGIVVVYEYATPEEAAVLLNEYVSGMLCLGKGGSAHATLTARNQEKTLIADIKDVELKRGRLVNHGKQMNWGIQGNIYTLDGNSHKTSPTGGMIFKGKLPIVNPDGDIVKGTQLSQDDYINVVRYLLKLLGVPMTEEVMQKIQRIIINPEYGSDYLDLLQLLKETQTGTVSAKKAEFIVFIGKKFDELRAFLPEISRIELVMSLSAIALEAFETQDTLGLDNEILNADKIRQFLLEQGMSDNDVEVLVPQNIRPLQPLTDHSGAVDSQFIAEGSQAQAA